jgi:predicted alpha/beta hydrolase family esterase
METNNIDLVKIVASDGHVLTEVEEVENRTFCSVVYTTTSSKDKWKEITQAEAVALQAGKTTAEIAADGHLYYTN